MRGNSAWNLRWVVFVLAVSLLLAGCAADDDPGASADTSPALTETSATSVGSPARSSGGLEDVPGIVDDVSPSVVSIVVGVDGVPQAQGSGVIWSPDGYIVTNNHVVEIGQEFQVGLADGRIREASVIGTDPPTDLAVIRVQADGLPAATFSDGVPEVGELVVALGNPFGFANSATAGIVSGLDRDLPGQGQSSALIGLIQTDAPISPGNSGGPLVDVDREVVGINVAAIPPETGASSLGFAIPSPLVSDVADSLIESGAVEHPFLGIRGRTLTPQVSQGFGLTVNHGVVVVGVLRDGPAADAGVQPGDVIVGIDGSEVDDMGDLLMELRRFEPGDEITMTVIRDGDEQQVQVALGTMPAG